MPIQHRQIPALPNRPKVTPFSGRIKRSYPVGKQSFIRAFKGEPFTVSISSETLFPKNMQARLLSSLNSPDKSKQVFPFSSTDHKTIICTIKPENSGVFTFRVEFSADKGKTWTKENVPDTIVFIDPPQVDALRIYTMVPLASGTITEWKSDLQRIKDLGFNAIHLLPLTMLDDSESPYSAKDLFEIDHAYADIKTNLSGHSQLGLFIEEAKKLELRICFDIVLNHVGVSSNIARIAPEWIIPDPEMADGFKRAGFWSEKGWQSWNDLLLINYEHPSEAIREEIWAYMTDYALFWAKYANETGGFVRFDNLHSSNPGFAKSLASSIHSEFPDVAFIAEYFTNEDTLVQTSLEWRLNLSLATPWDYKFAPQLRGYLGYIHRVSEYMRYLMPITTHDSGTPWQEFGSADSTIPRYVSAALMGTGATGITQGVEYGAERRIDIIGRKKKVNYPPEAKYAEFIRKVNSILVQYPVFRRGGNIEFVDGGHDAVIAVFRNDDDPTNHGFLVACNFDTGSAQFITVDLTSFIENNGPLPATDLLSGDQHVFPQSKLDLLLPPGSARVLMISGKGRNTSR